MDQGSWPVGETLVGKYRVDGVLGEGAMGLVVAAHHLVLDERVAIKILHASHARDPETTTRFVREARAAVRIKNEHVVRIYDVGRLDGGEPFLVMELLEGEDLASLVRQGPLLLSEAIDIVLQICEALGEAHALGIVHRDLKPANIFVTPRGDGAAFVKVLDFGLSKFLGADASAAITRTHATVGSPLYMSPEQLESAKDVDQRADIWSLGVILFELLTGRPPFRAEGLPQLVVRILNGKTPSLRSKRPEMPAALDAIVARCLAKDRNDRFAEVGELAAALAPFASTAGKASIARIRERSAERGSMNIRLKTPPPTGSSRPPPPRVASGAALARVSTRPVGRDGRRALTVAIAVAALALIGLTFLVVRTVRERRDLSPPASTSVAQ